APDDHSANRRRKQKYFSGLPANTFAVDWKCSAHQGHRVIENREREVIGNVHAVRVTCSQPHWQNKFQQALKQIIREDLASGGFQIQVPVPRWQARNDSLFSRTYLRRRTMVTADILDLSTPMDLVSDSAAAKFLLKWNGDWTLPKVSHYCSGPDCCGGLDDACDQLFGAAIEIDLLMSKDTGAPSLDDWFTCGEVCGKVGLGALCHRVLGRVIDLALPNPSLGMRRPARAENAGERARRIGQKKAWRGKYFLKDDEKLARADIGHIFDYYDVGKHNFLWSEMRGIGLDMASQVKWRYLPLEGYPLKLVGMVHPGLSEAQRRRRADAFFELEPCCLEPFFAAKVRRAFPSADAMFRDSDFRRMLISLAVVFKFCNMWCERLLALCRNATNHEKGVDIERFCCTGFLAQLLSQHRKNGGDDPRCPTRAQLIEDGAPVIAQPRQRKGQVSGVFVHWLSKQERVRKQSGPPMNKDEYAAWRRTKVTEFHEPTQQQIDAEKAEADRECALKRLEADDELPVDGLPLGSRGVLQTILEARGNTRTPFAPEEFEAEETAAAPGFTRYESTAREMIARDMFVSDSGDIADDEVFDYYVPCACAHPELCASKDAGRLPLLLEAARGLRQQLTKDSTGHFFCLRFVGPQVDAAAWFCAACVRLSNPAVAILCPALMDVDRRRVQLDFWDGVELEYLVDVSFLGRYLGHDEDVEITNIFLSAAAIDQEMLADSAAAVFLVDDWRSRLFNSEQPVFPPRGRLRQARGKKARKADGDAMADMRRGIRALGGDGDKIRIRRPKPEGHGSDDELWNDFGSGGSSGSLSPPNDGDSSSGADGPPVAGIKRPQPAEKEVRKVPFGPWTVSEVWSEGVHVGFGGNCNCHLDAGKDLRCKRNITFAGMSVVATRCLAKQWLLMGVGLAGDDARSQHVKGIPRAEIPIRDEAELDAAAL
ncbi:unnamed protein product, partial [Prorocentrum cordatum]